MTVGKATDMRFLDRLSLVIPCHDLTEDAVAGLRKTLDTVRGAEIVLVDDGSGPPLAQHLRDLAHQVSGRLVRLDANLGPLEARRAGLFAATREFIHFVDADDRVEPALYSALSDALPGADIVTFRAQTQAPDGTLEPRGKPESNHRLETRAEIMQGYFGFRYLFAVWNKILRRELALHTSRIPGSEDVAGSSLRA